MEHVHVSGWICTMSQGGGSSCGTGVDGPCGPVGVFIGLLQLNGQSIRTLSIKRTLLINRTLLLLSLLLFLTKKTVTFFRQSCRD